MLNLEPGEKIILEIRKHWWGIFTWGLSLFFMSLFPLIIEVFIKAFASEAITAEFTNLFGFFYSLWLIVIWIIFFVEWTDHYLDIWILTNYRIVDIEQQGLFHRDIATVKLTDIQDIKIASHGIISTFLKFGHLSIQTAGASKEFILKNAKNPEQARELIYSAMSSQVK